MADENRSSSPREYHSKSYTSSSRRDRDYDNSDGGHRSGGSDQNWRGNNRNSSNAPRSSGRYSETLEINRDHIGMIIGKGGSNIKDIQSRFSVYVNVDKNSNYSGTNSVSVSGDSQAYVDDAMNHIREQVENAQQRGYERRRDDRSERHQNSGGGHRSYDSDRHSRDGPRGRDRERDGGYGGGGYSDYKSKSDGYEKRDSYAAPE